MLMYVQIGSDTLSRSLNSFLYLMTPFYLRFMLVHKYRVHWAHALVSGAPDVNRSTIRIFPKNSQSSPPLQNVSRHHRKHEKHRFQQFSWKKIFKSCYKYVLQLPWLWPIGSVRDCIHSIEPSRWCSKSAHISDHTSIFRYIFWAQRI